MLANLSMIDFHLDAKTFVIKDVGRIAAKYYIRHQSIEVFQMLFKTRMTEADILDMLSESTEVFHFFRMHTDHDIEALFQFDQIQNRDSEAMELEQLKTFIPCDVRVRGHVRQVFTSSNGDTGGRQH